MDDGKLVKMEQDMSSAIDELLPQAEARAKVRRRDSSEHACAH